MSNYQNTKATIAANVYTNHNNEVTAAMVKAGINAVVDALIAGGFLYKGVATTSTNPGSPDANVFYIATAPGTYTNFGSLVVNDGEVAILKYNGSWSKEVTGAATAAEVTALGQKVSALDQKVDNIEADLYGGETTIEEDLVSLFIWTSSRFIAAADPESSGITIGSVMTSGSSASKANENYVDISEYSEIRITLTHMASATAAPGLCFYDSSHNVVQAVWRANLSPTGMVEETLTVPAGAKYIRTTWRSDYGDFSCIGVKTENVGGIISELSGGNSISEDITSEFTWTQQKFRDQLDGTLGASGSSSSYGSALVDIRKYDKLRVYVPCIPSADSAQINAGWAWYDENGVFIRGNAIRIPQSDTLTMAEVVLSVPKGAAYFATTKRTDGAVNTFACVGIISAKDEYTRIAGAVMDESVVNVKDYGAAGDGLVDDTTAILAAIASGKRKLYFPAGTYPIGKTINISDGMEVFGDGVGESIIKFLGASNAVAPGAPNYDIHSWRGNDAKTLMHTASGGANIYIHDLEIDGSAFKNNSMRYFGLSIYGVTDTKVENVYIHHINYDASRNPSVEYSFQFFIWNFSSRIEISRCVGDYGGYENIGTEDVTDVVIRDSVWKNGWRTSLQIHRGSKRVKVSDCTINNSSATAHASLTIHGVTSNPIEDLTIQGCTILSTTNENQGLRGGVAFVQSGVKNVIFEGNTFDGNSYCIVDLLDDGESATWPANFIITDNVLKNSRYGICLRRGNNYIIKDNIINSANTAIDIKVTNYIVKDNILPNNTTKTLAGTAWTD